MINNFDRAKIGYDKMDAHDKQIWNEAIEAAALKVDDEGCLCNCWSADPKNGALITLLL